MRNLRNIRHDVCQTAENITAACWDAGRDEIILAHGPTEDEPKVRLARVVDQTELTCQEITSWDALSPSPDLSVDRIVSLHYFGDLTTTCVILAGGDIVMVREPSEGFKDDVHIEIVGSVDPGIAAARWSPDEEVLALVTMRGTLLLMSRGFETIGETPLAPADLAASKHVSVGWGKKETQFKGRGAAKALRDPTIPEVVDEGTLSPGDDGAAVAISWRGDGEFVAVNAVEQIVDEAANGQTDAPPKRRRVVRVYNREGVLDSASEPVDGLESPLSWRPAGNLLATVQRKSSTAGEDRFNVIFFERNGLRHGEFELRPPETGAASGPVSLEWNTDSSVLAVTYESVVQLWTMGNYHWYLKQEFATLPRRPLTAWHPEKALRLLTTAAGGLVSAEYIFAVARGSVSPPNDHGVVAVIDGKTVKLTPLRSCNMPPPMSLFDLPVTSSAVDVAFSPDDGIFAVLHATGIGVFSWSWQTSGKRPPRPTLAGSLSFSTEESLNNVIPLQICFLQGQKNTIYVLGWKGKTCLASFSFVLEEGKLQHIAIEEASQVSVIFASSQGWDLCTQDPQGAISLLDTAAGSSLYRSLIKLPIILPWVDVVGSGDGGAGLTIGLSRNGHLYANERQLTKNCTSFVVTPDHLVFTTSNHLLKFVHLEVDSHDLEVPLDDPETDERCRSIEHGAQLVTSIPSSLSVVLQMPRGNLETIFPRAMVVAGIRKLIDALDYGRAFAYCRTQRVDMNILYDHKPDQFISNVSLFLDQLKDVTSIDLFLSSLREEDVAQTMYKDTKHVKTPVTNGTTTLVPPFSKPEHPPLSFPTQSSKVNSICDAVLAGLSTRKATNLQNIITAHVCKAPPALDDGLRVVAQLLKDDTKLAEQAVEHICFLVDVNRLYDHALGLYNLDLAMLIAQQSQRDPREYVPFIQSLHEKPELWRRFAIDDYLERHEKALGHLHALDAFADLLEYTTKHRLYKTALGLYRYDLQRLATVTNLYAGYLESQSKFREAGLAYESLGNFVRATSCYQSAGVSCWRECMFAAQSQDPALSEDTLKELASTLFEALYESRDYTSAAALQLEYLSSVEMAVRSLCKGYEFAEAMRVAVLHRRTDLLESAVDAGLAEALSSSTELLADCRAQLKAQVPRILELRRKAIEDPLGFYEGERLGGEDIPDDISVAASSRLSTSASLFTRYSTGTAATGKTGETGGSRATQQHRNRKKREEKKRARGRKGTVYEQEYLVNSVRRLVERVERARAEVSRLVLGLTRRNMAERARAIENLMTELIQACQTAIGEVWQPGTGPLGDAPHGSIENGNIRQEPGEQTGVETPPVIASFEKLSLLG